MSRLPAADTRHSGDSLVGLCVEHYLVTRKLGQGGMGAVYEAVHLQLRRKAAVKVLRPRFAQDPAMVQRFFNEACAVSQIHHAGLASVFAVGELADGSQYFLMEYLDGETLGRRLRAERNYQLLPALRLAEQLAATLAIVHAHDIVHCDLKPDNVMLIADPHVAGGERAVLLDFGIAQPRCELPPPSASLAEEPHHEDHLLGTPLYMSPEQCRGATRIDDKADVYALGVLLFRLCTGRFPFFGEVLELLVNHVAAQPPSPRQFNPALSPQLEALILRMLAKTPQARPPMTAVAATLAALTAALLCPQPAPPVENLPRRARPAASRPISAWALTVSLLLLAIQTLYLTSSRRSIFQAARSTLASAQRATAETEELPPGAFPR